MTPKKLYDRLSTSRQNRLLKSKELWIVKLLKESTSFYLLSLLDAVCVWWIINPDKEFNYDKFKKLFE